MLNFREITLNDMSLFNDFEYICSDYVFSYLYMFCEIYKLKIAESDNSIIIRSGNNKPVFYMPLGDTERGIAAILEYCKAKKIKPVIAKIPYTHLEYFNPAMFKIKEDRNSFDYIFRNRDLAGYEGKEFRKQRNNLSSFIKVYTPYYTEDIYNHVDECKAFTLSHFSKVDIYNPTLRLLGSMEKFDCRGGIVWNGDTMLGFCIYQKLTDDTVLSHVELCDTSHRGIHVYMINEMSKRIPEEYVNKEDDVGLAGLRRFKESYNPWDMLKKYSATME